MSTLRSISLGLVMAATPAGAFISDSDPQLHFFATCAGRLSALMEHQWTYDTAAVAQTTAQRSEMIDLVFAIMPENAGRTVLLMQVEAKHAQAGLLQRAAINRDPADANWARARADALLTECTSVLVSSSRR